MSRARPLIAAALVVLAAYAWLRAYLGPDPYVTLARPAAPPGSSATPPDASAALPGSSATLPVAPPGAPVAPPGAPAARALPATSPDRPPGHGPAPDAASRREPPGTAALRAALRALDRVRAGGYADPVRADPDAWAHRSCACRAEDGRRLRDLAARGLALRGHRTTVLAVVIARAGPATAHLLVTDRVGAYVTVDAAGRVRVRWPAAPPRRWRVTLVRASGRWLLGALARAP